MANRAAVFVVDRSFAALANPLQRAGTELLKLTKQVNGYFEIYLVGEHFMHKNVLAFPAPKEFPRPDLNARALGEIYLNPKYIKEHKEDLKYMLVHGFLHTLGYDHKKNSDKLNMEKKETELCRRISL